MEQGYQKWYNLEGAIPKDLAPRLYELVKMSRQLFHKIQYCKDQFSSVEFMLPQRVEEVLTGFDELTREFLGIVSENSEESDIEKLRQDYLASLVGTLYNKDLSNIQMADFSDPKRRGLHFLQAFGKVEAWMNYAIYHPITEYYESVFKESVCLPEISKRSLKRSGLFKEKKPEEDDEEEPEQGGDFEG